MDELRDSVKSDHPLWEYIDSIEKNMDNDSLLRAIGKRIGILVPEEEDQAVIYLYFALKEVIETQRDVNQLSRLINMSYHDFVNKYLTSTQEQENGQMLYWNRLLN